ncbi:MAG: hypothetical protein R3291_01315 [Thermoplasmata archaeon]|nr:hypothetical protein [Thermoplasmata archaeon]
MDEASDPGEGEARDDLGDPRLEYSPLPASPLLIALLILTLIVTAIGIPVASLTRLPFELWLLWIAPPLLVGGVVVLGRQSPLRLYEEGLEIPLPLWRRLAHARRSYRYEEVVNLYPRLYYVSGAVLSPFAASVGTVEHLGLALELRDGRAVTLKFTPGTPEFARGEDKGYAMVVEELRDVFRKAGRPWVTTVHPYQVEEITAMKRVAARPLLPFWVIVAAFFAPVVLLPGLFFLLTALGSPIEAPQLLLILVVGLAPPVAMLATSWRRSRRRHHYLKEISKYNEWKRGASEA